MDKDTKIVIFGIILTIVVFALAVFFRLKS
ncbi:hypothetical protein C8D79_0113 [Bacteriovorax stolpii]|nr:hypothetical protein C8D79_0113 [Bacteriovorax stolpii]